MATPRTNTNKNGNGGNEPSAQQIEEQIAQLRSDVAGLARTIAGYGSHKAGAARDQAIEKGHAVAAIPREAVSLLQGEIDMLERSLKARIRSRPLTTLGMAAGAGFLLALLSRRG
ncbi:DUF883 family protein [Nitratireductor mangrovi]|uniref:DUF883 family protein n=1 Tax=Nitratireductor mangrovi TaxID=2599600 RepID=A0A5B8L2Z5_9HYPH|nr:DUF883 family protein [Nitratireductor mangrovi]QDZ02255.1 DUF883 family protein [Nitratireductor mangrovi]